MLRPVVCERLFHLDIVGMVVGFISVDVVYLFAGKKPSPDLLFRHEAVLVRIPAHIRQVMIDTNSD